jgi:lysyl-tRNA synthetase class 2
MRSGNMAAGVSKQNGSSAVRELAYNADTQELYVTYAEGREYVYYGVPKEVYERFRSADSWGGFVNKEIKRRYFYRRLSPADDQRSTA